MSMAVLAGNASYPDPSKMPVATLKPHNSRGSASEGKPQVEMYNRLQRTVVKILYICTFHKTFNYVNSLLSLPPPRQGLGKYLFQGGTPKLKLNNLG